MCAFSFSLTRASSEFPDRRRLSLFWLSEEYKSRVQRAAGLAGFATAPSQGSHACSGSVSAQPLREQGERGGQHGEDGLSPPRRLGKEIVRGCQSERKSLGVMGIAKEKAVCPRLQGRAEGTEKMLNKEGSGYGLKRRDRSNLTKCVYNQ